MMKVKNIFFVHNSYDSFLESSETISHFFTCHIWNIIRKYWFSVEKNEFFITDFHDLGLFLVKKHDLGEKKISVCHAPLPLNAKFVPQLQPPP
jgi:hypothetical protein